MAKQPKLNIFFLLLSFYSILPISVSGSSSGFIEAECRTTHYPALCMQSLSNYTATIQQSQIQLARAALSVSLTRAGSAASFISKVAKMRSIKPTDYRAVQDCIQNMGGSIDQLTRSLTELGGVERQGVASQGFSWHVGNMQTWISSALTYQNMCLDSFRANGINSNVKAAVTRKVVVCARVTSNALALVNRFAARHNKAGDSFYPKH